MKRKATWIIMALFAAFGTSFTASAWDFGIKGSGVVKSETRSLAGFTGLVVESSADVTVSMGDETSCTISADDNLLPLILTEIDGDMLRITTKGSMSTSNPIAVRVTTPHLNIFNLKGSGMIVIEIIAEEKLDLLINGSGEILVSGSVNELTAGVNGSGEIKAAELQAKTVSAVINGSGNIEVFATDVLTAEIRGIGNITYNGNPAKKHTSVSGSGEIRSR